MRACQLHVVAKESQICAPCKQVTATRNYMFNSSVLTIFSERVADSLPVRSIGGRHCNSTQHDLFGMREWRKIR